MLSPAVDISRGTAVASSKVMHAINNEALENIIGGAGQAELRSLAQRWCPSTYARYAQAPALTRRMGERCLDEAGLGAYKSQLDQYFK